HLVAYVFVAKLGQRVGLHHPCQHGPANLHRGHVGAPASSGRTSVTDIHPTPYRVTAVISGRTSRSAGSVPSPLGPCRDHASTALAILESAPGQWSWTTQSVSGAPPCAARVAKASAANRIGSTEPVGAGSTGRRRGGGGGVAGWGALPR